MLRVEVESHGNCFCWKIVFVESGRTFKYSNVRYKTFALAFDAGDEYLDSY